MTHSHKKDWDLAEAKLRKAHDSSEEMVAYRYNLGVEHCTQGLKPTNQNHDYLRGYGDQYAYEQAASAEDK